jgi:hypothetical protein
MKNTTSITIAIIGMVHPIVILFPVELMASPVLFIELPTAMADCPNLERSDVFESLWDRKPEE